MTPHDITDLYLAPVTLAVDSEISRLAHRTPDELTLHITLATDRQPFTLDERREYLLDAVTRHHEMHGWVASWDSRGIRLTHHDHTLVLGVPAEVASFVGLAEAGATAS